LPPHYQNSIWIHAVSVGETLTAISLVKQLKQSYPNTPIVFTTMTPTGSERVKAALKNQVFHIYVPYDLPCVIKRFLNKVNPRFLIIMETELWPNLIYYTSQRNIPILLANARLSEHSYNNYKRIKKFIASALQKITIIAAQTKKDAERFAQLGAQPSAIQITGNIKFDTTLPQSIEEKGQQLRQQLGPDRPIWIAASTHEGEEAIILQAFKKIKVNLPNCLLILVPRHPERFTKVAELCQQHDFQIVSRSSNQPCTADTDVFLGDTMGELMLFYAASDVAFVGGSLQAKIGGHNLLEPAALALPIIAGSYLFNFTEISELLLEANALVIIHNAQELSNNVTHFLTHPKQSKASGKRAQTVVEQNRGTIEKHIRLIKQINPL